MSFDALPSVLAAAARLNPVAGFVAMASQGDGEAYLDAFGARSAASPEPMAADSIFWVASFTKLVTSVVALQLIEAGRLSLDQPVAGVLADFADLPILEGYDAAGAPLLRRAADRPTVRHLLTHTSGLGYQFMDHDLARYAAAEGVGPDAARRLPRRFEAGARWQYGVSTDWLGAVVEAVAGQGLDEVFQNQVFGLLGMTDTTFALSEAQKPRVAAMHARLPDGDLSVIDFAMPPLNFSSGGGGLYATAADFMRLLRALLDGAILGEASRGALFANQVGDLPAGVLISSNPALTNDFDPMPGQTMGWSFGLMLNPSRGPNGRAAGSGAWAGLPNCHYWLDPAKGLAALLLAQVLPFADPKALGLLATFERAVYA
ncbi:MAG TPA: serine hydrolase domain-containing protein [Caulobacteraceae bacterium]